MPYFRTSRNVELSTIYYLTTNLEADWSGITVAKTFNQVYAKDVSLPIVLDRLADISTTRLEIGTTTLENRYLLILDIFARSDAQRLDLADYIKEKINAGWTHYDFSHVSGDKTELSRTANGRNTVTDFINDSRLDFGESGDEKDRFRHSISVRVRNNAIT